MNCCFKINQYKPREIVTILCTLLFTTSLKFTYPYQYFSSLLRKYSLSFCSNFLHSLKNIEKIMLDALLMNKTTMFTICDELTVFLVLKIPIFIKKGKKLKNVALLKRKKNICLLPKSKWLSSPLKKCVRANHCFKFAHCN